MADRQLQADVLSPAIGVRCGASTSPRRWTRRLSTSSDGLRIRRRVAMNDVDVPTLMRDVRADAERAPARQWADADAS
jgi:hypothetical protein